MIPRRRSLERLDEVYRVHPVAAVLGPRQTGKTTLAQMYSADRVSTFFDLENPVDVQRLSAPMTVLEGLNGLVVIDEIQRRPDLFALLRVLVDRPSSRTRFLVLGSAAPNLVRGAADTLAGRVGFVDLAGFSLEEVGLERQERLWVRGGFPRSFLAPDDQASASWRESFIRTFLERDIPQLGISVPAETLRRFWTMIAHYHGQRWNGSELGRALGTTETTARRYLDILAGAFLVRVLPPWFENLKKRQVKAPKAYLRDSGILHALLQLPHLEAVQGHPKLGASWEGFAIEQILGVVGAADAYHWASHGGAELDLFVRTAGRRFGFELKYSDAPSRTRSMHVAVADLGLDHLFVVYPGAHRYELDTKITAVPLGDAASALAGFQGSRAIDSRPNQRA